MTKAAHRPIFLTPTGRGSDLEQIRNLDCEYAVVRVPAGAIELMFKLEDMGYHYIESMLDIQHDLKNIGLTLGSTTKRIADSVTYAEMNGEELEELWAQLRRGIFNTDRFSPCGREKNGTIYSFCHLANMPSHSRIYVDPAFTPNKPANRYIGWLGDELNRGGKIFKCELKGKTFGYFVSKLDADNVNHVINIGTYKEYENAGLGVCLVNATLRQALEIEARMSVSGISSNNMPSIKANLAAGYIIVSAQYIYIKHNEV